ncbi:ABC transporter permease [Phaeodactylibacter xiamenensis]|uniref:ABC transporter permease n=1 Tax=Phaeodactylibacter xiamenensis TaxID=1524460 RepID=UPI003CCC0292
MQRVLFNFLLAVEGVNANKLRSFLTALGIIFGVGAVIAMLAIGTGAKQAILDQMKLIGTNNIVIEAVVPESGDEIRTENEEEEEKKPYSPGLSLADLASIQKTVPTVDRLSPEIILPVSVVRAGRQEKGRCIGVENAFFELNGLEIGQGIAFQPVHMEKGEAVCIIGTEVKKRFFSEEDPIGKLIKCGKTWLRVIGVLKKRNASEESLARLGIRDYNSDVYIPVSTALLRFRNRALITPDDLGNNDENKAKNYHQLDRLVVRVDDSKKLRASADVIARILQRRHLQVPDVEIEVPELLLEQEQQTQETFNLVLAVIAGISLLVGGIGIMNIMLASVLERIKEIGVRRSLGATQLDIILQFLFEAVFISLIGGLIGVLLGVGAAKTIASYAEIPTIVSAWSILLSFGVAASIGLVFGLFPAQKAAKQDPIKALRSD